MMLHDVDQRQQHDVVQVLILEPCSGGIANAMTSSNLADESSIAEKTIATLPTEMADMAKNPKRKAQSSDLGWKFGF
jgi:hypothetical protein